MPSCPSLDIPPVLEAIATLLSTERNYHRVHQAVAAGNGDEMEVDLLIRISDSLLDRDHDEKALPNFIDNIAADVDGDLAQQMRERLYDREEQCARILARVLNKAFPCQLIADSALNARYEAAVSLWCPEHPFIDDTRFRNVVFAALAVARCALSNRGEYRQLAQEYATIHRPTYHLLYFMGQLSKGRKIHGQCMNMLVQASDPWN